jgi:O-antigen/teichoic acid export membrane protein
MITKLRTLKSHVGFMKYFRNTSWLFGEKILRMFVGLFVGIWVARYLGPEQFGLFSYSQAFVALYAGIATLGLDTIVVRELVKDGSKKDILLSTVFWLKFIGALIVLIITFISLVFTNSTETTTTMIYIIAFSIVFQSFNIIDLFFQSKILSKYVVFANSITLLISSAVKILLIINDADVIWFAYSILFDSIILATGLLYFYINQNNKLFIFNFDKKIATNLLANSWPLILSSLALGVQAYIDQVMIMHMLGSVEVGYYSVAIKLIALFSFIPSIIQNTFNPAIINAKKTNENLYQTRLLNYYRLNVSLFFLSALPIFIFSEQIVTITFGEEYRSAGVLLSLMAIRLLFANLGVARSSYILAENIFKYALVTMIIGAISNIAMNYYLIPIYGSEGAIVATIISFLITIFLIDVLNKKTRENALLMLYSLATFYKIKLKEI